ncbi:hypothetical protein NP233_g12347 [Leucocoprinus birnbaumii]|uniref:DUF6593 domain-containing protein n=1 Tax=Leucocoprinus birnbaumii TaxID=56174 RepID=A0AAD5VF96_9AGAR|nr:hypothetical protein NP233_g12347 [Leucocoprinus birnbaumii]
MRLVMSNANPRNCTYRNEAGQVLYKIHKPITVDGAGTATIQKAVETVKGVWLGESTHTELPGRGRSPFVDDAGADSSEKWYEGKDDSDRRSLDKDFAGSDGEEEDTKDLPALEGHLAFYAQVEFRCWHSSRFRIDGREISVNDYFRKGSWSSYGRDRVFTASDGKEYRWHMGSNVIDMIRNDESKARVALFKEEHITIGPFKGRPASLEVDDSCIPILDEIILTFIYCEKLRNDRTYYATRRNSGAGLMGWKTGKAE